MTSKIFYFSFIFYFSLLTAQENQSADSIFQATASEDDLAKRFSVLDSLSLVLEDENYVKPYEKVQLELIDLGIKIDSIDRVAYQGIALSWFYNNIQRQPKKSVELTKNLLELDQSKIRDFYIGLLYRELADAYFFLGDNTLSIQHYELAVEIFEALDNKKVLAETLMYLSAPQSNIGDFVNAIQTMEVALQLFEEVEDQYHISGMRIEMGLLLKKYGFLDEAEEQYQLLLDEGQATSAQLSAVYINKANIAKANEDYEGFFKFMDLAEQHAIESDRPDFILPVVMLSKVEVYFSLNDIQNANEVFSAYQENYKSTQTAFESPITKINALKLLSEGNLKAAIVEYEKLVELESSKKNWAKVVEAKKNLADLYQEVNDDAKALQNQSQYIKLKDSIEQDKKLKALGYYKTQFETERKDKQISQQSSQIQVLNLQNENKQKLITIILTVSVFSILIILFLRKYLQSKREQQLQENFSQRLLSVQEEERLKISRDLHDSIGQSLSLVKREVQQREILDIDQLLGNTIKDLRDVSQSIYPYNLKNFGLSYAAEQLCAKIEKTTDLQIKLKIQDIGKVADEDLILNIYRLIQEALNNIVKHANATHVVVIVMEKSNEIVVKVKDNGDGFDVKYKMKTSKSFGLQTMQQRINIIKGKLNIESTDEGTELEAYIPLV